MPKTEAEQRKNPANEYDNVKQRLGDAVRVLESLFAEHESDHDDLEEGYGCLQYRSKILATLLAELGMLHPAVLDEVRNAAAAIAFAEMLVGLRERMAKVQANDKSKDATPPPSDRELDELLSFFDKNPDIQVH